MIYLLTVNYYSTSLIARLIQSLPSQQEITYQIVIVNNSPADQELKLLESDRLKIIESQTNLGFGKACNLGLMKIYAQDPQGIVWIINPDTYLSSNILEKVPVFFASHQEISILGTLIYTPKDKLWFGGGCFIPQLGAIFSTNLFSARPEIDWLPCDWVSGCSLLINLSLFKSCPQFDSAYFLYYEDFDFCRRYALQGHQIAITNQLAVVHQPSSIANRNMAIKLQHSTYSYLLTLERYANPLIFWLRFFRLFLFSLILLGIKPQAALGKFVGILNYLRHL
ncbi:MAG: glycosyltransferase family 2 protein [Xenococcaceae cyanobacterium MO_188.B32]|nr:glycosyltransferase family 2 protein [Xenococcaceae cyanobacterium MO_188.B32]